MKEETKKQLDYMLKTLEKAGVYDHAGHIVQFDMETACPRDAMEEQADLVAYLNNQVFKLTHTKAFIAAVDHLHAHEEELSVHEKAMVDSFYRMFRRTRDIPASVDHKINKVFNKAYVDWIKAKEAADYSLFEPSLKAVREAELKKMEYIHDRKERPYDELLDLFEPGMTQEVLDDCFAACTERLLPLLAKIRKSPKKIRTDFLYREVPDTAQAEMSRYLMDLLGYDFNRGMFTTTEHPFTDSLGRKDTRITTHYDPHHFISSMYSIIHETGHALFDMFSPDAEWDYHYHEEKSMGQHESVSRFYENIVGRSRAFTDLIYDKTCEIFPTAMKGVSPDEFYEGINMVEPSLVRTEADEFTYVFHIIIRYEMEKLIVNEKADIRKLPLLWKEKYEHYLGVTPGNDAEGILQDVHWTSGFGYFPTYALGNFYNAMYYNRMKKELDVPGLIAKGQIPVINHWMEENVWKNAARLDADPWIREITGRSLDPTDFLDYLENKYGQIYGL
ncbi:MAG: carboxypeptidase M32 [Lachnospiraceae bacterium]|nr:carboxypeptidase M32 [Lachnospiraceae bacterium]